MSSSLRPAPQTVRDQVTIRRALLSVSDKTGLVELARGLSAHGVELLSTGGSAKLLRENSIAVIDVAEHTGFPEIMDGRVKTLQPKIHGALLGRRGVDDAVMQEHDIAPIDLLVVNLYPFSSAVAAASCTLAEAIEHIDIGGPAMLRAAAKNFADVAVATHPGQYPRLLDALATSGGLRLTDRAAFAIEAFNHVAQYEAAISSYLSSIDPASIAPASFSAPAQRSAFPAQLNVSLVKVETLRYGENPHQAAAFYREPESAKGTLAGYEQLQGKALSFNNLADADAAWAAVTAFEAPACVIVKHANPCGVAVSHNTLMAYERAYQTDPTSAFGGIIAFNRPLDGDTAQAMVARQFIEVVIAPEITPAAARALAAKPNVRVLQLALAEPAPALDFKRISGGMLVQDADLGSLADCELRTVTQRAPTAQEIIDLRFAWTVAKYVKSNAIVYARDQQTVGIGAGQMSRVYSAKIAGIKAADEGIAVAGCVMASDAFFPFRDGIDAAAQAGISAVIHPGGSMRDDEVIAAANEHGMAMIFTGMRHFRH